MGALDDGDAGPTLDGQQRQLTDEVADPAGAAPGPPMIHLATGSLRPVPVHIRVPARRRQSTCATGPARPRIDVLGC